MPIQFDIPNAERAAKRAQAHNDWLKKKWPLLAHLLPQKTPEQVIAGVEATNQHWRDHDREVRARIADLKDAVLEILGAETLASLEAAMPDYCKRETGLGYEADYWWQIIKRRCPEIAYLLCLSCTVEKNRQWYIKRGEACPVCKHLWKRSDR